MMRYKHYYWLILVLLLASFVRLLWLDIVPNGISGDEIDYVFSAKTALLTGHDVVGEWSPMSVFWFKYPTTQFPMAELSYFVHLLPISLANFSLLAARLPYAFFSVLAVLMVYLVAKKLLGRNIAIAASFIAAINPWNIYIGRTSYDLSITPLFYLLALYFLLTQKGWRILIVIPVFYLSFYSHIGTKLVLFPFAVVTLFYAYRYVNKGRYLKQYVIVLASCVFLIGLFAYSLISSPSTSRVSDLLMPNNPEIAEYVIATRRDSITTPYTVFFVNKYVVFAQFLIMKFVRTFSTENLFLYGDRFVGIFNHGLFYYADALFLLMGSLMLFVKKRKELVLLLVLTIVGTITQLLSSGQDNAAHHSVMIFPFLIMIIGSGIWYLLEMVKRNNYLFRLTTAIIIFTYVALLASFLNIYFFQHSLYGNLELNKRIVAKYISLANEERVTHVFGNDSSDVFRKYLLYSNILNRSNISAIGGNYKKDVYEYNNIKFTSCAPDSDYKQSADLFIVDSICETVEQDHISIARLNDGGELYKIYNDQICSSYSLNRYPQNIKLSDYAIEKLSQKEFCETYITRL